MIGAWTLAALAMLEVVTKGALILAVALALSRVLGRRDAAVRHLVLASGLASLLLLPLLTLALPGATVWTLRLSNAEAVRAVEPVPSLAGGGHPTRGPRGNVEGAPGIDFEAERRRNPPESPWAIGLLAIWTAGTVVVLARSAFGIHTLRVMTRRASVDAGPDMDGLAASIGLNRPWTLRSATTSELPGAMTWGLVHPVVLLPRQASTWSAVRRRAVLLHELAHVLRYDYASQTMAEVVCALNWFNPLAWRASRELRRSAESAADDIVIRSGVKASEYALALLEIAADLRNCRQPFALLGVSAMSQTKIESRLRTILNSDARRRGVTSVHALAVLATATLSVGALAVVHGRVGAGQNPQPTPAVAQARTKTLLNLKAIALATVMWAADNEDALPYATNTATAVDAIRRYVKDMSVFKSPTPGGKYLFNTNLGGVSMTVPDDVANLPMWVEVLPDKDAPFAVAFADGHVKLIGLAGRPAIEKELRRHFARRPGIKPLPVRKSPQP